MKPTPRRRGTRATLGVLARTAAGAALLAFVIVRADPGAATLRWDARASAGLAAAVALVALAQVLSAARWRLVLGPEDAPPFGRLLRLYLVGQFFSLFLPTSVGGDAVRAVAVSRGARRPAWAVSSVVFERFLGMLALLAVLAAGGIAAPEVFRASAGRASPGVRPGPAGIALAILLLAVLSLAGWRMLRRSERVRRVAGEAAALWTGLAARPVAFGAALGTSLGVQGAYVGAWLALALGLRLPVGAGEMLVFVPFVSLAAMVPVTVAGIGVRVGAWALLLAPYGVAAADAVAFSLLYFLAFCLVGAAGGLVFALEGMGRASSAPGAVPRPADGALPAG
jgi:uncharacterized membrane protein YbhN (UPF0104 family)